MTMVEEHMAELNIYFYTNFEYNSLNSSSFSFDP